MPIDSNILLYHVITKQAFEAIVDFTFQRATFWTDKEQAEEAFELITNVGDTAIVLIRPFSDFSLIDIEQLEMTVDDDHGIILLRHSLLTIEKIPFESTRLTSFSLFS